MIYKIIVFFIVYLYYVDFQKKNKNESRINLCMK